jgi:hypothetical protein
MAEGYDGCSVSVAGVSAGKREQETVPFDVEHAATPQIVACAFCAGTPLRDQLEVAGSGRLATAIDGAARAVAARFGTTDLVGGSAALVATAAKG